METSRLCPILSDSPRVDPNVERTPLSAAVDLDLGFAFDFDSRKVRRRSSTAVRFSPALIDAHSLISRVQSAVLRRHIEFLLAEKWPSVSLHRWCLSVTTPSLIGERTQ